jgi:putative transposase
MSSGGDCAFTCFSMGVSRATYYRHENPRLRLFLPRVSVRAYTLEEKQGILTVLNSEEMVDLPASQVYTRLLDKGLYLGSKSTLYRVLNEYSAVKERRQQKQRVNYEEPRLMTNAPNQVWTADISKLRGPEKWVFYYLYVLLDLFSRYAVAWMVSMAENALLFQDLIEQGYHSQGLTKESGVWVHTDRGSPMKAKSTAQFEMDLGILQSFSRPRVSNDNPFSESNFKTLKYRPETPERFGSFEHSQSWARQVLPWYNTIHYHSGIADLTPASVHFGRAPQILKSRDKVKADAFADRPDRFNNRPPKLLELPKEVWINKPTGKELQFATPGKVILNSHG